MIRPMRSRFLRRLRLARRIVVPAIGFFAVLIGLAVLVPPLIDWTSAKPLLERRLSSLLGASVRIEGTIGVRLLPNPALDIGGIVLERPSEGLHVETRRLLLGARLLPLLVGDIDIHSSILEHPVITLRDVAPAAPVPGLAPAESISGARAPRWIGTPHLGRLKLAVVDGVFRGDRPAGDATGFSADVTYEGDSRTVIGNGAIGSGTKRHVVRFAADDLKPGSAHLRLLIDDEQASASAVFDGRVAIAGLDRGSPGAIEVSGSADAVGAVALWNASQPRSLSWHASARVEGGGGEIRFHEVKGVIGSAPKENTVTGEGRIRIGKTLQFSLDLKSSLIDLDQQIGIGAPPVILPFDALTEIRQIFAPKTEGPNPLDFKVSVAIDSVRSGRDTISNFHFTASGRGEPWTIEDAGGDMPGGARLTIKGTPLETLSVANILSGHLSLSVADQARFFDWIDGQSAPADGGAAPPPETVTLEADAVFEPTSLWLPKLAIAFGGADFTGNARYVLPAPIPQAQPARRDHGKILADLRSATVDLVRFPFATLKETPFVSPDLLMSLRIDKLDYRSLSASGLDMTFRREGATRAIEKLTIADLAGAKITGTGSVDGSATGRLTLESGDLDGFAQALKTLSPGPLSTLFAARAGTLSPAKIELSATLDRESSEPILRFSGTGLLDQTRLAATGDWQAGPSTRRNHLSLNFNAADQVKLLRQLGFPGRLGEVVEPGTLALTAKGNIGRGFDIMVAGEAARTKMKLDGRLVFTSPTAPFEGKLTLDVPDAARLGGVAGANAGLIAPGTEASVKGRLIASPERLLLTEATVDIRSKTQPLSTVTGELAVHFEDKPRIAGQLRSTYLDARWLATVPLGEPAETAEGWSDHPFAPPRPPTLSGAVWIEVEKLAVTPALQLDGGQFAVRVQPDEIDFLNSELRFAGGRLNGDLSLSRRGNEASVVATVKFSDVETQRLSGIPLSARMNGTLPLSGSGNSPRALLRSLFGKSTLALRDIRFDSVSASVLAATALPNAGASLPPTVEKQVAAKVDDAMRTGAVLASFATVPITLAVGQLSLGPLIVNTPSGLTLAEAQFDLAAMSLSASARIETKDALTDTAPRQTLVTWAGRPGQLTRTIDVSPKPIDMGAISDRVPVTDGQSLPHPAKAPN